MNRSADCHWLTVCTGCLQSAAGLFEAAGKPDKAAALYMEAGSWEDARRLANFSGSPALHLSLAAQLEGELPFFELCRTCARAFLELSKTFASFLALLLVPKRHSARCSRQPSVTPTLNFSLAAELEGELQSSQCHLPMIEG